MNNYEKLVYPKSELNDHLVNLDYLSNKSLYNPIGQRRSVFHPQRLFFVTPLYAKSANWGAQTPLKHYLFRLIGGAVLLNLGYRLGTHEAEIGNEIGKNSKVVEFESEDQIFDYLHNKGKDAVFLHMYVPGQQRNFNFYRVMEEESVDPDYKDIVFMNVHCRKHVNFCVNKAFTMRIEPYAELYYINEEDQIELMDMESWHRSRRGIRGFFYNAGILEKPKVFDIF